MYFPKTTSCASVEKSIGRSTQFDVVIQFMLVVLIPFLFHWLFLAALHPPLPEMVHTRSEHELVQSFQATYSIVSALVPSIAGVIAALVLKRTRIPHWHAIAIWITFITAFTLLAEGAASRTICMEMNRRRIQDYKQLNLMFTDRRYTSNGATQNRNQ